MDYLEPFTNLRDFLDAGGDVLWVILGATVLLWTLILERFLYFRTSFPERLRGILSKWQGRVETKSWYAHKIRLKAISQIKSEMNRTVPIIKTLVGVCPLLGLLGTVTGMIAVFDSMALMGTGNARLMAAGISMATIPTMAGMVAALSGIYFGSRLESRVEKETQALQDRLQFEV